MTLKEKGSKSYWKNTITHYFKKAPMDVYTLHVSKEHEEENHIKIWHNYVFYCIKYFHSLLLL